MSLRGIALAAALALLGACATAPLPSPAAEAAQEVRAPVTILVSIDGFRPDYLGRGDTPTLDSMAAAGVRAEMRPSFPTKTFPNHYTIVTGLRPDRHGIVDNNMEDPARPGVRFSLGNAAQALDPFWWDGAEPLWVTAEKQGVRSATMFWPGSEVPIRGTRPSDWQRFDENISNRQRIDAVTDWLRRPAAERPRFLTLYFDTVDTAGHNFGPNAAETIAAVRDVDAHLGRLAQRLAKMGQPANFVIVSDHGMAATSAERVVRLDTLLDPASFRAVSDGAFAGIEPQPGRDKEVETALLKPRPHMECRRKEELPARFEYGRHKRVPRIFCLAETGWLLLAKEPSYSPNGGTHGYDNQHPDMKAVFIASGPSIRAGGVLPIFDNIHVYPLLARLIGVAPQPSDAQGAVLEAALK